MVWRQIASVPETATVPIPDSKSGELRDEEEFNVQAVGSQYLEPLLTPPPPGVPDIERANGMVSLSCTQQVTQF